METSTDWSPRWLVGESGSRLSQNLFFRLICGGHTGAHEDEEEERRRRHHQDSLSSLKQTRTQKAGLAVGLVVILAVDVAMYIFWSVHDFREGPYYPEGSALPLPGDGANVTV
ncbi:hypothetical protein ACOMHN_040641 [Nucella lapillus]